MFIIPATSGRISAPLTNLPFLLDVTLTISYYDRTSPSVLLQVVALAARQSGILAYRSVSLFMHEVGTALER